MKPGKKLHTVLAHLARNGRRWIWRYDACPICGKAHQHDAGAVSGSPIVAPALAACRRSPDAPAEAYHVLPACLALPCATCPARPSRRN